MDKVVHVFCDSSRARHTADPNLLSDADFRSACAHRTCDGQLSRCFWMPSPLPFSCSGSIVQRREHPLSPSACPVEFFGSLLYLLRQGWSGNCSPWCWAQLTCCNNKVQCMVDFLPCLSLSEVCLFQLWWLFDICAIHCHDLDCSQFAAASKAEDV